MNGTPVWNVPVMLPLLLLQLVLLLAAENSLGARSRSVHIIGGSTAAMGVLPYQVSLRSLTRGSYHGHFCGGTIVSYSYVLTAAHCARGQMIAYLYVVAGSLRLSPNADEPSRATRSVSQITVHDQYDGDPNHPHYDIALLKLSQPLPALDPNIFPIALQTSGVTDGDSCVVSGWGDTTGNGSGKLVVSEYLMEAEVLFISTETCQTPRYIYGSLVKSDQLCAGYDEGGQDACQGDSGGPLVCGGLLTGIVSWGYDCAVARSPGVYTSVKFFHSWITENMVLETNTNSMSSFGSTVHLLLSTHALAVTLCICAYELKGRAFSVP